MILGSRARNEDRDGGLRRDVRRVGRGGWSSRWRDGMAGSSRTVEQCVVMHKGAWSRTLCGLL